MQNSRLIILAFSLYFIARQLMRFIKHEQSQTLLKTFSIVSIWGGVMSIVLLKSVSMDSLYALILLAFIVVFLLLFRLLGIIEKIEREITEIVRKEALRESNNFKQRRK